MMSIVLPNRMISENLRLLNIVLGERSVSFEKAVPQLYVAQRSITHSSVIKINFPICFSKFSNQQISLSNVASKVA